MKRFGLILALAFPMLAFAHDVPDEVRIRAFLKPEGGQMRILVRIPANALIDILFPTLPDSPWLDLNRAGGFAEEGARTWVAPLVGLYEDDKRLLEPNVIAVRMTQMPDGDFATYEKALQHIHRDRSSGDGLFTQDEAAVDVELSTPIRSELSNFSIEPRFARVGVRVTTSLAFLRRAGGIRQFEFEGDPERVYLDPGAADAILRFFREGYRHLFSASDYLFFLLSLGLVCRTARQLARFTILMVLSQSVAFLGAAFGLWISSPWAESLWGVLVAATVVYAGFEAIARQASQRTQAVVGIVSGFIFGTGYWFAFRPEMQFGGTHKLASVLAFDGGIQAVQVCILVVSAAATRLVLRLTRAPEVASIVCGAIVLRISWHHMLDRARVLSMSTVVRPVLTPAVVTAIAIISFLAILTACANRWKRST